MKTTYNVQQDQIHHFINCFSTIIIIINIINNT